MMMMRGVILGKSQPRFCVPTEAKGPISSKNGSSRGKVDVSGHFQPRQERQKRH